MATSNQYLYFYGNRIINNARFQIGTDIGSENQASNDIQIVELARGSGGRVVSSRRSPKQITISSSILPSFANQSMEDAVKDYKSIFIEEDRYFRIVPDYEVLLNPIATTGLTNSGSAGSLSINSNFWEYTDLDNPTGSKGSIEFDISTSTATATITTTTLGADVSSYANTTSNFEFMVYIPDVSIVSSISFKIGNDASNYFSGSTNLNYEGKPLSNGWNLISINFVFRRYEDGTDSTVTVKNGETGTVNLANTFNYFQLNIGTDQSKAVAGCMLGALFWVNEDRVRNHRTYQQGVISFDKSYKYSTTNRNAVVSLINQTGYGESTHSFQQFSLTSQTALSTTKTVDFDGSFEPKPYQTLTLNTATNIRNLVYANRTTGDNIALTRDWTDGDISVLDSLTPDITTNGQDQDPGDYNLPTPVLGRNTLSIYFEQSNNEDLNYLDQNSKERRVGGVYYLAQSFTPTITGTLTTAGMRYIRQITATGTGTFSNNLSLYIMSDSAGSPGSILTTSSNFSIYTYANNVAEIIDSKLYTPLPS